MSEITLQIYSGAGRFQSHQLIPGGPVSLGRAEHNRIILTGPSIAPRHLELTYDQHEGTWSVTALSPLGTPTLNGFFLPPNHPYPLGQHSLVRVGDYELRFLRPPVTRPEQRAMVTSLPITAPTIYQTPVETAPITLGSAHWITAQISRGPEGGIIPGEGVTFDLTLTNSGPRLANFKIEIIGLNFQYQLKPMYKIPIDTGESTTVSLTFTPQRLASTRAGDYSLTFRVTDPEHYPGLYCDCSSPITILPFYAFEVERPPFPLSRKVAWHAEKIGFDFDLENCGNAPARFRLAGQDLAEECNFGFMRQLSEKYLRNGATVTIEADSKVTYRVWVQPQSFPIFLRKKTLPFTLSITPQENRQETATLSGKIVQRPLIGWPWLVLTGLLLLPICIWLMLWPHLISFKADGQLHNITKQENETVRLQWRAWPPGVDLELKPDIGLVSNQPVGDIEVTVVPNQIYEIQASTFLCDLTNLVLGRLCVVTKTVSINVTPIAPHVEPLRASADQVTQGQPEEITVSVDIRDAETAELQVNRTPHPLATEDYHSDQTFELDQDTSIVAVAQRNSFTVTQEIYVPAVTPTPSPTPAPKLGKLAFSDTQVTAGEPLTLDYAVEGVAEVILLPDGIRYPANGTISLTPTDSTNYTLIAVDDQGNQSVLASQQVIVESPTSTPAPTPTPAAPTIVEFRASETNILIRTGGDNDDDDDDNIITLSWTVEGDTTNIELLNKAGVVIQNNLPKVSRFDIPVSEDDTQFVLVAYNGSQEKRQAILLNINKVERPIIYSFRATVGNNYNFTRGDCGTTEKNTEDRLVCVITPTITDANPLTITFVWEANNADEVRIEDSSKIHGTQKPEGTAVVNYTNSGDDRLPVNGQKFTLIARNEADEAKRKIRICYQQTSLPEDCR